MLNGSLTTAGEFETAVLAVAALVFGFAVAGGAIVAGVTLQREALKQREKVLKFWLKFWVFYPSVCVNKE